MPTCRAKVRTFIGKLSYYRRFIKNFSGVARPLTDTLAADKDDPLPATATKKTRNQKETAPLKITDDFQRAFLTLREALVNAPILAFPDFKSSEPFILDTD